MTPEELHRTAVEWTTRGAALVGQKRVREAAECFCRAVDADPAYLPAHTNLGLCLETLGDLRGAVDVFRRLVEADPTSWETWRKLGDLHVVLGDVATAAMHYRNGTLLAPDDARLHQNLGSALGTLGQYLEAIEHFRRAIRIQPDCADFYRGLGLALVKTCDYEEAEQCLRQAVALAPMSSRMHANLGEALQCAGRMDEALVHYNRAIELSSLDHQARMGRAMCLFSKGEFEAGWADYESRAELGYFRVRHNAPQWKGEPLAGRTLLIETEQGFGDAIQYVRYAAEIKKLHAGRIVFACEPQMIPLLTGITGVDRLIPQNGPRLPFDCWISLLSLPGVFAHRLDTFPATTPYLYAEPSRVGEWKSKLASLPGKKIGIAWQGNATFPQDRERSIPLANFLRLEQCPGVTLVSLQKGPGTEQLAACSGNRIVTLGEEFDAAGGAFLDTAAVMMNLDLVITSDTSIAHVAGALGVPVWVALPLVPHWRWTLTGERTPWYPTMRLFRQIRRGDWAEVFDRIATELSARRP